MLTCLSTDQRVNAPAAVYPHGHAGTVEALQNFEHVVAGHAGTVAIASASKQHPLTLVAVRSVFVFPSADLEHVEHRVTQLASGGRGRLDEPWVISTAEATPALYVSLQSVADDRAPLFGDWDTSAVEELEATLGHRPEWAVACDVSGRIPGDDEIRALVVELLADGGVAVDDYSDHCWTAEEIADGRRVDGLAFFDYRTDFKTTRLREW
jgi:hypothetical protein